jgi:hypothetical protein
MLAIAISMLFGLATFAALLVVWLSGVAGLRSARLILAELTRMERGAQARPVARVPSPLRPSVRLAGA